MKKCNICPHACELHDGETGVCHVIWNNDGTLVNSRHGRCSSIAVEYIEKRPFFHFDVGERYLTVGLYGCSMNCGFCQNYSISQQIGRGRSVDIVTLADQKHVDGIAFTYNEPTLHYKYIAEIGLNKRVVIKTNGFATPVVWTCLRPFVMAYNVDIKGDELDYERNGGSLYHVRKSIEKLFLSGRHLEISYLVTPTILHNRQYHVWTAKWLSKMSRYIPVHVLYLYPCHKVSESYDPIELLPVYDIFRCHLDFVYISNLYDNRFMKYRDSRCPICGKVMVSRQSRAKIISLECCGQRFFC